MCNIENQLKKLDDNGDDEERFFTNAVSQTRQHTAVIQIRTSYNQQLSLKTKIKRSSRGVKKRIIPFLDRSCR
jgi:hypothetical protein